MNIGSSFEIFAYLMSTLKRILDYVKCDAPKTGHHIWSRQSWPRQKVLSPTIELGVRRPCARDNTHDWRTVHATEALCHARQRRSTERA